MIIHPALMYRTRTRPGTRL